MDLIALPTFNALVDQFFDHMAILSMEHKQATVLQLSGIANTLQNLFRPCTEYNNFLQRKALLEEWIANNPPNNPPNNQAPPNNPPNNQPPPNNYRPRIPRGGRRNTRKAKKSRKHRK